MEVETAPGVIMSMGVHRLSRQRVFMIAYWSSAEALHVEGAHAAKMHITFLSMEIRTILTV